MSAEARIEHLYPEVLDFVRLHGAEALVVLHDLVAHALECDGILVSQASTRQIAERLEFLSKDSVHRRLRQLNRARVISRIDASRTPFEPPTYVIDLTGTGIALTSTRRRNV
jgi:DNA-binding HxlR family transcriptional regulator